MKKYSSVKDGLDIYRKDGSKLKLRVITDEIIRVSGAGPNKDFSLPALIKYRFINDSLPMPTFKIKKKKRTLSLAQIN